MYNPADGKENKKAGGSGSDDDFDAVSFAKFLTHGADTFIDSNTGLPCITVKTKTGGLCTFDVESTSFSDYLLAEAERLRNEYLAPYIFTAFVSTLAAKIRRANIKRRQKT